MKDAFLFYVVGRSGVGKDTVLNQLRSVNGCTVAHRYITRKPEAVGENHIHLTSEEFIERRALGAFLLDWEAHGHRYGIGIEVKHWLACGMSVFVNGSRHCLAQTRTLLGQQMVSVLIDANDEVCHQRIAQRGRESQVEIKARMLRESVDKAAFDWVIDNSGPLEDTINAIHHVFQSTVTKKSRVQ